MASANEQAGPPAGVKNFSHRRRCGGGQVLDWTKTGRISSVAPAAEPSSASVSACVVSHMVANLGLEPRIGSTDALSLEELTAQIRAAGHALPAGVQ